MMIACITLGVLWMTAECLLDYLEHAEGFEDEDGFHYKDDP